MHLLNSWWLDVKLGIRILFKYPGLTFSGVIGIAVAVAIAAGGFSVVQVNLLSTSIPLDEGGRIVALDLWDASANKVESRVARDFHAWRGGLKSVRQISAFQNLTLNWIEPGVAPESVQVAAMSASGFEVARVRPILGRVLTEGDERPASPPVAVIGESVWRNRFGSNPAILGRAIKLGGATYTVAGVMPKSFGFPVNHQFWIPLRLPATVEPLTGPGLSVFGRLAPGATLDSARAELTAAGKRAAIEFPNTYAALQPRAEPYASWVFQLRGSEDMAGIFAAQGIVVGLLVLVCLNVAVLVYTRTAMRQPEISLRTALGAPRGRIVVQLFIEALVLAALATSIGVALASIALDQLTIATENIRADLPFWLSFRLSPGAVLYSAILSILAAAIIGVIPGLQATGRSLQSSTRVAGTGDTGMRMGKIWSALIVAQAGFAVALLPIAVASVGENLPHTLAGPGFAADQFLSATLSMQAANTAGHAELMRRLSADPAVSNATFSMREVGDERGVRIEAEGRPGRVYEAGMNQIDLNYFRTFDVPVLAGRELKAEDIAPGATVLVNEALAERLFDGAAVGKRIRYAAGEPGRWYEIAGVVRNFPPGVSASMRDTPLKFYHPAAPGQIQPAILTMRVRGAAQNFGNALRQTAVSVDPNLVVRNIRTVEQALRKEQWILRMESSVVLAVTISVLLLVSAGIYALMSFTVSQRRHEIGVRMALGASGASIVRSIFSRALLQLGSGAALGACAAVAIAKSVPGEQPYAMTALVGVMLVIAAVGFLAALSPTRRCLKTHPTEVLRQS